MRALDRTLGPRVVFQSAASKEQRDNLAPCFGPQLFVGDQRRETETLTVTLKSVVGRYGQLLSSQNLTKDAQSFMAAKQNLGAGRRP
jgi:hypothetical protein